MSTRQEAVAAAAQVYRQILADPERAAEIRAHREQLAAAAENGRPDVGGRQDGSNPTQK